MNQSLDFQIRLSDSRPQPIVFPGTFQMPLKEDDEEPQTELLNADNVVRTDDPVGDPVQQQDHGDCSLKESTPPRKRVKFDLEDKENYSSDGKIASEEEEDNCYVEVYYVDGEDYKPDATDVKGEDYKPDANNEKICENNGMSVHTTCVAKAKSSTKVEDESLEDGELADETTEQTEVVEVQDLQ
ncbi:hypothetical protein COOONC_02437 [Cooperia oncophora]